MAISAFKLLSRSKPAPLTDRAVLNAVFNELQSLRREVQEIKTMVTDDFAALGEQYDTFTASIGPTVAKAVANAEEAKDANAADNLALMQGKLTAAQDALTAATTPTPAAPAQQQQSGSTAVTVATVVTNPADNSNTVTYSDGTTAVLPAGTPVPAVGSPK